MLVQSTDVRRYEKPCLRASKGLPDLKLEADAINALALAMVPAGEEPAHLYQAYARKRDDV